MLPGVSHVANIHPHEGEMNVWASRQSAAGKRAAKPSKAHHPAGMKTAAPAAGQREVDPAARA